MGRNVSSNNWGMGSNSFFPFSFGRLRGGFYVFFLFSK
jgi:hypothetical protein